jgi:hypothetical protein
LDISWALFPVLGEGRWPALAGRKGWEGWGESCEWPSGKTLELERAGPARRTGRIVLIVSESDVYWPSRTPGDAPIVSPHSLSLTLSGKNLVAWRGTSLSAGRQSWEQRPGRSCCLRSQGPIAKLIKDNNLDKAEGDATPSFVFGMNPTALSLFLSLSRFLCFFLEALQWLPLLHDPASD